MSNIVYAFAALQFVRNSGVIATNRFCEQRHFVNKPDRMALVVARQQRLTEIRLASTENPTSSPAAVMRYGLGVVRGHVGNCYDMACAAAFYLEKKSVEYTIMQFPEGDHTILVLGQPRGVYPDRFEAWAADAVICDPWADIACLAHEYPLRWKARLMNWHIMGLTVDCYSPLKDNLYHLANTPKLPVLFSSNT